MQISPSFLVYTSLLVSLCYSLDYPSCSLGCTGTAFKQQSAGMNSCTSATDDLCLCTSTAYLEGISSCLSDRCQDLDDAETSWNGYASQCNNRGHDIGTLQAWLDSTPPMITSLGPTDAQNGTSATVPNSIGQTKSPRSISRGAIICISVGTFVFTIVVGVLATWFYVRRRQRKMAEDDEVREIIGNAISKTSADVSDTSLAGGGLESNQSKQHAFQNFSRLSVVKPGKRFR